MICNKCTWRSNSNLEPAKFAILRILDFVEWNLSKFDDFGVFWKAEIEIYPNWWLDFGENYQISKFCQNSNFGIHQNCKFHQNSKFHQSPNLMISSKFVKLSSKFETFVVKMTKFNFRVKDQKFGFELGLRISNFRFSPKSKIWQKIIKKFRHGGLS